MKTVCINCVHGNKKIWESPCDKCMHEVGVLLRLGDVEKAKIFPCYEKEKEDVFRK